MGLLLKGISPDLISGGELRVVRKVCALAVKETVQDHYLYGSQA